MRPPLLIALVVLSLPAVAQDSYLDDRSTATSVINSFYNAVNRQEYLRAWSYYDHPTVSFGQLKAGYKDTASVTLLTGPETADGAAGSTIYTVPVAIDAVDSSGQHTQFAGCYTLKLVQPALQGTPPFKPLSIEKGSLKAASGALDSILPKSCGD